MKTKITLLTALYFGLTTIFGTISFAQNTTNDFSIKGKIINEDNTAIEIGNVILLSTQDSSMIHGDVFFDGEIFLKNISTNEFILQVTALGYDDFSKTYENVKTLLDFGTITLKSTMLKGIEVVARHQLYEKKGDNVVVNVANTSLSNSGTALDVLRNSPKVVLNNQGQVSVIGKGKALIYVDGQLIASDQILQSLSSNDLKEIEIIENPSAKYDAAGNAVVNIKTKKRAIDGYKIGLMQSGEQGKYKRANLRMDTYYKLSKFMFQTSYGIRAYKWGLKSYYGRTYEHNNDLVEIDNKYDFTLKAKVHDYNFKTTYLLNDANKIGLHYSGSYSNSDRDGLNRNVFDENGVNKFRMNTYVTGPFQQKTNTWNLFYERSIDTLGSQLSVSGQYSTYDLERIENIHQVSLRDASTSSIDRRTFNTNDIGVASVQLDYNKYFTKNISIESGVKNANVTNNSILNFEAKEEDGSFTLFPEFSTDYEYKENILAAYTQLTYQGNSWKVNVGLRGEWTQVDGASLNIENGKLFSKQYFNIFPSASISKNINSSLSASLSYNYRIQRPSFQDLNPFTFYVDSLVSFRGNPDLLPEYSYNISGAINYKNWSLGLNYNYTKDKINTTIELKDLDEPAIFDFRRDNTVSTEMYAATLSYPIQAKGYSSYNSFTARLEDHKYMDLGALVSNRKAGIYLYTNQTFYLPYDFALEIIYQFTSPRVDGLYTDNSISALRVGVSRKFFNNALTARFIGNDILDKYRFVGIASVYNNKWTYTSEGDYHYIKLSLNWDFGKLGTSHLREKKISQEELNRINRK